MSIKIIASGQKEKKDWEINEQTLTDLWDKINSLTFVSSESQKEMEKIMARNFLNVAKKCKPTKQRNSVNSTKNKPKEIYTQTYNNQTTKKNPKDMDKEKRILKAIREKQQIIYFKGTATSMAADFLLKIMEVRRMWNRY